MRIVSRQQPEEGSADPEKTDGAGYVEQDRTDHNRKCRRIPHGSSDLGLGKSRTTSDWEGERHVESALIWWIVRRGEPRHHEVDR